MTEKRTAKPADAKAVWDSFIAKNEEPSVRLVATAMNASGQFHKIHPSTVGRWKLAGWKAVTKKGAKPKAVKAASDISALVPVLTGDPESRTEDVAGVAGASENKDAEPDEFVDMSDADLMQLAARELFKTAILISRQIQDNPLIAITNPEEIGGLQTALAGSLGTATDSFTEMLGIQERLMKLIPGTVTIDAEADPLKEALAAFEKEEVTDG